MAGKNDEDLSGLSPEEIAALSDDSDPVEDQVLDELAAGDDPEDDPEDDPVDLDPEDPNEDPAEDPADPEDPPAEDPEDPEDPPVDRQFQPDIAVAPVENYAERLAELNTAKENLRKQLTEGEIELEEYDRKKDEIVDQITDLRLQQNNYENEVARRKSEGQQRWQWEQDVFFGRKENAIYRENDLLGAALDTAVRKLATDPANANQTGSWFLEEADRQVRAVFQGGKAEDPKAGKDTKPPVRKPNLKDIPPTLKDIPPAAETETGESEFAYLDKLSGADLERELAKISRDPVKEARYLRS